jgi:UPF0271 protein
MRKIDLNADIAEGFPWDEELLRVLSSASICSGIYAGSRQLSVEMSKRAREQGVRVGLHFGFPDRDNFGRVLPVEGVPAEWVDSILEQLLDSNSSSYVKPHGATYHWLANEDTKDTQRVWNALEDIQKPMMGLIGTRHELECRRRRIPFISEGFCERAYDEHGKLIPRTFKNATLYAIPEICRQASDLAERCDSICIHGDRPDCVDIAISVKAALERMGCEVRA